MKATFFDLDDTLYPEMDFVRSGFFSVANFIASNYYLSRDVLISRLLTIFDRDGRGKIFDTLLWELGIYTQEMLKRLIDIYRYHTPVIKLYLESMSTLLTIKNSGMKLGLITDGLAPVQKNKIAALNLSEIFDVIICTDDLPQGNSKPSTTPFTIALNTLHIEPAEAVYIGNDPSKDFYGPNRLGMETIQFRRDENPGALQSGLYSANHVVSRINEVLTFL